MLTSNDLKSALAFAIPKLDEIVSTGAAFGMERVIQLSLLAELEKQHGKQALIEQKLKKYQGKSVIWDVEDPRIDIVYPSPRGPRVVELKVVRLPRLKRGSPKQALYDWGQMTADYARTVRTKALFGGELVALLYGPGIEALPAAHIARAFHNHMFLDYETARLYGELKPQEISGEIEEKQEQRRLQKKAGKALGWDRPYLAKRSNATAVKDGKYALISLPIPDTRNR
ncbi:hypothetical protein VDS34_06040 [Xanthomonas campestris pv. campestris]|nr:hypothetical protein [Xanthomonas campestris pv. campestris]